MKIIRKGGIKVRFIDGPMWGGLGHDYAGLTAAVKKSRVIAFLRAAGRKCAAANLIIAVEPLRAHEDKVTGGTIAMIEILEAVGLSNVKLHFDVFHSVENGENPAEMIQRGSSWIVYLHLHGNLRVAPGSEKDRQDWKTIGAAIREINSGVTDIVALPEPFGAKTRQANPALGEGLPEVPPMPEYLDTAYATFWAADLPLAA